MIVLLKYIYSFDNDGECSITILEFLASLSPVAGYKASLLFPSHLTSPFR